MLRFPLAVTCNNVSSVIGRLPNGRIPGQSKKKRPAFERLLLPECISNDILQYLIK